MQPPVDPGSVALVAVRRGTPAGRRVPPMATCPTTPGGSVAPVRADDPDLDPGQGQPTEPEVPPAVTHRHGGDGAELGHAVPAQDLRRRAARHRSDAGSPRRSARCRC